MMNIGATSAAALAYRNAQLPAGESKLATRAKEAAQDYEAFFVAQAFDEMFSGLDADPVFGGGEGENMFRSFLIQEYGKQVAKTGGIGVADTIQRQLLQLQEASR